MDFQNMKRKQLQALCKKHGIPANKTNIEMATLLASTLKVSDSENAVLETKDEEEEEEEVVVVDGDNNEKRSKKVRFSPDVETREYEPSVYKGRGGRVSRKRNVVDLKEKKQVVKSRIVSRSEKSKEVLKEVGNRRGLGKREDVGAKKRRFSDAYNKNLGGIRVTASEEKSEFGGEIEGRSDEIGNEGGEGLVGRNVSRRKSVLPQKNDEKKAVVGNILESAEKSEKVSLEIETLRDMKRKELQSLCKKHGIPANKTNLEMARLLAAALKVSQETGSSQRPVSAIEASQTQCEIERMEQFNGEEPSGDNEGGCDEVLRPCGNEEGVGNVGELIEEETVILREESILVTEAAVTESISLVEQPIQDTKLMTPEVTKRVKKTKGYKSRSNRKIRDLGDGVDGLSDAKENSDNAQCVEENQNSTPVVDELPRSQTTLIRFSSANQPGLTGLEKGMEVEEMSRGKDSQHANRDFNDHSNENDCSIQLESDVHPSLDDIEAPVDYEPSANFEVGHNESDSLGRTLDEEEIFCTVQETKDNERDIGLILLSNNNNLEQVKLSDENEGNNASANGAYEETLHSQNFGDCSTEIREESKDILDGGNHNASKTISELDIPEDISDLTDQKEKTVLESDCSVDAAPVVDVISSEDMDVDTHVEELAVQDEDLVCATQDEDLICHRLTHSRGEPSFNQTSCDGFEVSRMEIVDSAVTLNAEIPTKTLNSENVEVQDANDSGIKEVASYLNENSDERVSQNIQNESRFSEKWSVEQLEGKEIESEFGNSQVSDFTQSIPDNLNEGEPAEKHGHCEDICEINGEAIDNGTHMESPKTLGMQQASNGSSSSPCMLGLFFPDEREEFTEIQSAAPETLSEDSKVPIGTSETVNDSLEINLEKSGQLDNFMRKNSIEMNEDMFVDSENVISGNIKPVDAMEIVENMDELAEELTTPLALTSNKKQAKQSFTEEIPENMDELTEELTTPLALTSNKKRAKESFTEEVPVYSNSCGKSEKKSIHTFSELKDLPFYDTAELENETSNAAAPALVGANEEYNDEEEPSTDALQEGRRSKDYVPVMPITENVTDLERLETIVVEKQLGNASLTDWNESIHADDEISNGLSNFAAIRKEHTEQVRDKNKNVEIEHSSAVEGMSMEASVGAIVADKLNFFPAVDSIDTKGAIDASNDKHDSANQLSEIDDVVNEGFSLSDINFSTPSELTSEDKNKGCVMVANEAPLHKPNVEDSAAFQNKETMDVEGFHLISSSKCETLEDSFAVSIVNASHYDREQEVEKPATEAQQLSLMKEDVMEIQENSKRNKQTAGELEDQHGENSYSAEEEVAELNMSNKRDVSVLLHIEENEHLSMQDDLPLKVDEIQGSCSLEIQEESVKAETKKDDFSGRLGVNEQFLSEDVQPDSSVLDQSISCTNVAVGQEFTSDFEDQHGQNVHLEEDGVVQAKMCSNHDISESLLIDEIEQNDLPLKGVQIQGSCSPEIDKGENVKVENYPFNSENNEIAGLVDVSTETLSSEHVHELPSLARTQSISPLNPTVGQGTVEENNVQSELKLPSAETTSLIVKQEEQRRGIAKQLISPALKSKHRRTVLIHGTPKRVFESSEMKENMPSTKMQQAGSLTAHRALPKRRPLEDLRKI